MRDLRVQEFLREFIAGIVAPGDLAGLIIVEILHSDEGGDVEQVLEPQNNSPVFAIAHLSLTCVLISCMLTLLISLYA